jgi:dephospho-CoA kinase
MQMPGGECYKGMIDLLGTQIVLPDKTLDRSLMAGILFEDRELMEKVNQLVHPAVKRYVGGAISRAASEGLSLAAVESAILVQSGFSGICDEIWYIHADESVRRQRLKQSRGYSDRKITEIFSSQRTEESFRQCCNLTIDNSSENLQNTFRQIDLAMLRRGILPSHEKWNP